MNRAETTKFLSDLLVSERLTGRGKYYAREVSLDYGTINVKRVDFMQFEPNGVVYQSDIEKGIFTCYEVKSCKEDVYSGNGLNFVGEKNYIVTTMECYKAIKEDIRSGKLWKHIEECCLELSSHSSPHFGIIVPVPRSINLVDEYENPTKLSNDIAWELKVILPCNKGSRKRSMTELLFCMLRSGH